LKKYLAQQRDFHERHLGHSLERREQRSQRPPRELVHDVPYRELKKQTGLLQNTDRRFVVKIRQVEDSVGELKKFRHQLAQDLDGKRAALTVDKTCIDMVAGDVKIQEMENHGTTGLPYGWKKETMHVVEDADVARRQAEKLRKICFRAARKRSDLARDQHDALQVALHLSHPVQHVALHSYHNYITLILHLCHTLTLCSTGSYNCGTLCSTWHYNCGS
jgi:hypothetical protein